VTTTAGDAPLLEVRNVSKTYSFRQRAHGVNVAVSLVSFTLERGEILGVVGESGCGKSTLARCVAGLHEPTSGTIQFRGRPFSEMSTSERREFRREVQIIFQDPYASLNPRKRVGQIVGEPLRSYGVPPRERSTSVHDLLAKVGLRSEDSLSYPRVFSGGQRQRIAIARSIILGPSLLIADEPVSSLDVSIQAQILNLLLDLRAERNLAMLFISHDLAVIRHVADRILVMYRGTVVETGAVADLYSRPAHPYTRQLLSASSMAGLTAAGRAPGPQVGVVGSHDEVGARGCCFRARCPDAEDVCYEDRPALAPISASQSAACHFPWKGETDDTEPVRPTDGHPVL
jgi:oligopeptide/dipeptide ABC transporter ATP-binding protein